MLLGKQPWGDIERMPAFEREYHFEELKKLLTDPKTGEFKLPVL